MDKKEVIRIIDNWYQRKLSGEDVLYGSTLKKLLDDIENYKHNAKEGLNEQENKE